jgi:hypothetical protein
MRALPQLWQRPPENQSRIHAQMIDPPADDVARALPLFSEHVLQHRLVQAQFGHQLFHARRLTPFHGGNTGSNPVGDANKIKGFRKTTAFPHDPS